jgi:hypothetical protein
LEESKKFGGWQRRKYFYQRRIRAKKSIYLMTFRIGDFLASFRSGRKEQDKFHPTEVFVKRRVNEGAKEEKERRIS